MATPTRDPAVTGVIPDASPETDVSPVVGSGTSPRADDGTSLPPAAIDLATRMFDAARTNDLPLLTSALTAGLPPNLTNSTGNTLLMLASYHGHLELTTLLLARGADPNVLNERGQSPLAGTVFKGEQAVAEALLRGGADPDLGAPSAREALGIFGVERLRRERPEMGGAEAGGEGWAEMMERLAGKGAEASGEGEGEGEGDRDEGWAEKEGQRNDVEGKVSFK